MNLAINDNTSLFRYVTRLLNCSFLDYSVNASKYYKPYLLEVLYDISNNIKIHVIHSIKQLGAN